VLSHGGWSRAIARHAFAGRVPAEIITRRTKGGVSNHQKSLLMRNVRFIRDFLLDGAIVRHGIVDRRKLEVALGSEPTTLSTMASELQWYLYTEAWVASWRGHQQHLAA
jgi:asparagine synthase (glutamine-hydrolysing)